MRRSAWLGLLGFALLLLPPVSADASTIVYTLTGGSVINGAGCRVGALTCSPATGTGNRKFKFLSSTAASGTITLDTTNQTLDFSITVASVVFDDTVGAYLGVDEIRFSNVTYSATGLAYSIAGPNITITAGQTVTVSDDYEQFLAGSSVEGPTTFNETTQIAGGSCSLTGGLSALSCGFLDIGPGAGGNLFDLLIGDTPTYTPESFKFLHKLGAITAVPEPGTAFLFGMGLFGLVWSGRRRL